MEEDPRQTLQGTGRTRTASPARRRRAADAEIVAQGDWRTVLETALSAEASRQGAKRLRLANCLDTAI